MKKVKSLLKRLLRSVLIGVIGYCVLFTSITKFKEQSIIYTFTIEGEITPDFLTMAHFYSMMFILDWVADHNDFFAGRTVFKLLMEEEQINYLNNKDIFVTGKQLQERYTSGILEHAKL